MTSANVTHYEIYDREMNLLATDSQHCMCKDSITEVLEKWEKEFPDAIIRLRWPDEQEVDQYLTFEEIDGYDDMGFDPDVFWADPRDTITLRAFMRRRRIRAIESKKGMVKWLRKTLKEYTGNQVVSGGRQRVEFNKFRNDAVAAAEELGDHVRARTWIDEDDGEFHSEFLVTCKTFRDAKMVSEVLEEFSE